MQTKTFSLLPIVFAIAAGILVPSSASMAAGHHATKPAPRKKAPAAQQAAAKPAAAPPAAATTPAPAAPAAAAPAKTG